MSINRLKHHKNIFKISTCHSQERIVQYFACVFIICNSNFLKKNCCKSGQIKFLSPKRINCGEPYIKFLSLNYLNNHVFCFL